MYAIVDIETTGGSAAFHKITEVAILIHDGKQVVDEYQTLINPECGIPMGITSLTGITNEMVADAPKFFEVGKEIFEMLENNIFVAHNVNFDYSFLKHEFQSLGGNLNLNKLCTVRLSRKILPGYKSYSLGKLCDELGIGINGRHRAMGDAKATAELMTLLIESDDELHIEKFLKKNSREADLPPYLPKKVFDELPDTTGVYYFHDEHGKVIYVGKANNIKKRIRGHFSTTDVVYKQGLKDKLYDITYEVCGDELIAFLLESFEIKRLFPFFNKAQKYPSAKYGLYHYEDGKGIHRLSIGRIAKGHPALVAFTSFDRARNYLIKKVKEFNLDPDVCSLPASVMMGFGYSFDTDGQNAQIEQNERLALAIDAIRNDKPSYCLLGQGRHYPEKSVVLMLKGVYQGFGFYDSKEATISTLSDVQTIIKQYPDNPDVQRIVNQFIAKRELIEFDL
jgi:DNA polymerase III subunit epsilon